jgi:hypothetical protein
MPIASERPRSIFFELPLKMSEEEAERLVSTLDSRFPHLKLILTYPRMAE